MKEHTKLYNDHTSKQTINVQHVSHVMRKSAFCICENKDADQRLSFRNTDSTIPLLPKPLAIFCGGTSRFVSGLVGNPEDRFSHNEAH